MSAPSPPPRSYVRGLVCRVCGRVYPPTPIHFCEDDFGPLEVGYDLATLKGTLKRDVIAARPPNMWRWRELLPLQSEPTIGIHVGGTPLIRADRLAHALGVDQLWLKDEGACQPTLSFKDRVVSVALNAARELGLTTIGCSSTGNLAHSVAALAASAGLESFIFVPANTEPSRMTSASAYGAKVIAVQGTYDDANRLCSQAADQLGWGFVNVNLRPFYVEGCKTVGYEIAEQLGWRAPRHIIVPLASGGLLCKIGQAFKELGTLEWIAESPCSLYGAQPSGCNPIVAAVQAGHAEPRPIRHPETLCKSLAVGDPGDGVFAVEMIRNSNGWAVDATDAEIVEAMTLLAKTEGILTEPAGGVVVAAARKLIAQGRIGRGEEVVLCLTGHGVKTVDVLGEHLSSPPQIKPSLAEFHRLIEKKSPS